MSNELEISCRRASLSNFLIGLRCSGSHLSSSLSCVELLTALLYYQKSWDCDIIISKGHGALAWYCALCEMDYLSYEDLLNFSDVNSPLSIHVSRQVSENTPLSSGSLGHGLSFAAGIALGKYLKNPSKISPTFVLIGDGESNEGSIWEAALFAGTRQLNGLVCIADYNKVQAVGNFAEINGRQSLEEKFKAFDWNCSWVNAHNPTNILKTLNSLDFSRPNFILSETLPSAPFYEYQNDVKWHYAKPTHEDFEKMYSKFGTDSNLNDLFEVLM